MRAEWQYDAFLSYASVPDERLVRRTRRFLAGFHRQWLLRSLRLRALAVCLDGQDFKLRSGKTLEAVEDTLRSYVGQSQYLIVFCSAGAVKSPYVNAEIAVFLEQHPPSAVLPIVSEGDPGRAPETVFPQALLDHGLDKVIWLDFRGARTWWWQRRARRIRPYDEERARLAVTLHGEAPNILPTWKRARAIRRALGTAAVLALVVTGSAWWMEARRNRALATSEAVVQEVLNPGAGAAPELRIASMRELQAYAAEATRLFHVFETDAAYREAAALTLRRITTPEPLSGVHAVAGARLWRLTSNGIESSAQPETGRFEPQLAGAFSHFEVSEDGATVVAIEKSGGVAVWHKGTITRCDGLPSAATPRALALEPGGQRFAVLLQADTVWSVALGRPGACASEPLTVHALWGAAGAVDATGTLGSAPRADRIRVRLNRGGSALAVSSDANWMVGKLDAAGTRLIPLNPILDASLKDDVRTIVPGMPDPPLAIADEAFSADGAYIAVAGVRDDGLEPLTGPRTVLLSLLDQSTLAIDASRGNRRVAMAKRGPRVAFTSGYFVRVLDWTARKEVSSTPLRGSVAALEFAAADELLLVADRDTQPHVIAVDVGSGRRLGQVETELLTSLRSSGDEGRTLLSASRGETRLYELRPLVNVVRFPAGSDTAAVGGHAGVLLTTGKARQVECLAAQSACLDRREPLTLSHDEAVFAAANDVVLYKRGTGACVGSPQAADACVPLPIRERALSAGAVSSDGSVVAVAFPREATGEIHSLIEIYRRVRTARFPWLGSEYVKQSAIEDPGEVRALGFSGDTMWLASASHWQTEWVVRRFPVSHAAMLVDAQRHD